jgi:hypothetical protein
VTGNYNAELVNQFLDVDFSVPITNLIKRFIRHFNLKIPENGAEWALHIAGREGKLWFFILIYNIQRSSSI